MLIHIAGIVASIVTTPANAAWKYSQSRLSVCMSALFGLQLLNAFSYKLQFQYAGLPVHLQKIQVKVG